MNEITIPPRINKIMIIGRNFIEDQKLYSTGDDYLDELMERAFCEGYEYAQREFGNPQNKAAKRNYEAGLGGFGGVGTLGKANTRMQNNPAKFKDIKSASVNVGRSRQNNGSVVPAFGDKFKNIDQVINYRGSANTNPRTGRPWKNMWNGSMTHSFVGSLRGF